jgi:hypothetical protein
MYVFHISWFNDVTGCACCVALWLPNVTEDVVQTCTWRLSLVYVMCVCLTHTLCQYVQCSMTRVPMTSMQIAKIMYLTHTFSEMYIMIHSYTYTVCKIYIMTHSYTYKVREIYIMIHSRIWYMWMLCIFITLPNIYGIILLHNSSRNATANRTSCAL